MISSDVSTAFLWACLLTFVVEFVRALPFPLAWRAQKPLSCPACMTGWTVIGVGTFELFTRGNPAFFPLLLSSGGITLILLAILHKLTDTWTPPR